jgi:hypothetical protein
MFGAIQVQAPEGCDVAALSRLQVRDGVDVRATIVAGEGFEGSVALETEGATFPVRTVSATQCGEVAAALALIAELAVQRLPKTPEPHGPIAPIATARTSVYPLRLEPSWHFSVGAHGGGTYGRAPSIAPTAPLFVDLQRDPWTLRATVLWSHRASAALDVTQVALRFEACPLHVVGGDFELDPCAGIELGAIRGRADEASTGLWLAPGGIARARWRFAHPFFAELEAAASFPLLRPRFVLLPDETVWKAPPVSVSAGLGLGMMIW